MSGRCSFRSLSLLLTLAAGLPLAQAQEPTPTEPPVALPEVTVRDRRNLGYQVLGATSATKLDTPILETPVSIQVVPRAVLEDQQVIELKDALKNVSGVQSAFGFGSLFNGFTIRGFTSQVLNMAVFSKRTAPANKRVRDGQRRSD